MAGRLIIGALDEKHVVTSHFPDFSSIMTCQPFCHGILSWLALGLTCSSHHVRRMHSNFAHCNDNLEASYKLVADDRYNLLRSRK